MSIRDGESHTPSENHSSKSTPRQMTFFMRKILFEIESGFSAFCCRASSNCSITASHTRRHHERKIVMHRLDWHNECGANDVYVYRPNGTHSLASCGLCRFVLVSIFFSRFFRLHARFVLCVVAGWFVCLGSVSWGLRDADINHVNWCDTCMDRRLWNHNLVIWVIGAVSRRWVTEKSPFYFFIFSGKCLMKRQVKRKTAKRKSQFWWQPRRANTNQFSISSHLHRWSNQMSARKSMFERKPPTSNSWTISKLSETT